MFSIYKRSSMQYKMLMVEKIGCSCIEYCYSPGTNTMWLIIRHLPAFLNIEPGKDISGRFINLAIHQMVNMLSVLLGLLVFTTTPTQTSTCCLPTQMEGTLGFSSGYQVKNKGFRTEVRSLYTGSCGIPPLFGTLF